MSLSNLVCAEGTQELFCQISPDGFTYLDNFVSAVGWTLELSLYAWIVAMICGLFVGIGLTSKKAWIKHLCTLYVEVFRNIPLLVQLFLWYFVIPELFPEKISQAIINMPFPSSVFWPSVLCLGLFTSVRLAVQLSTGINTLPKGQSMAATALGLSRFQMYRYVLLPMATRIMLPTTASEILNLVKNSSLAYTIGLMEITGVAAAMQEATFRPFPAYIAATLLYVLINLIILFFMHRIERWVAIPGYISNKK